jgi:hypothetical protein
VIAMLKNYLPAGVVLLALAACATSPTDQKATTAKAQPPLGCVSDTATRLPVSGNECAGVGSTYTKKDMDQTGQPYAQDALRMLDPTLRVHGGP